MIFDESAFARTLAIWLFSSLFARSFTHLAFAKKAPCRDEVQGERSAATGSTRPLRVRWLRLRNWGQNPIYRARHFRARLR